jgi:hypothetical protein
VIGHYYANNPSRGQTYSLRMSPWRNVRNE